MAQNSAFVFARLAAVEQRQAQDQRRGQAGPDLHEGRRRREMVSAPFEVVVGDGVAEAHQPVQKAVERLVGVEGLPAVGQHAQHADVVQEVVKPEHPEGGEQASGPGEA
jgi:hypothetical protein